MILHQVIHGYAQGHALLATSAELSPEERRRLNALSDLSGYLDRGQDFDRYWTGYPCGRFYVVAETRPDREAERRGLLDWGLDPDSPSQARLALRLLCPPLGTLSDILGRLDALLAFPTVSPALAEAEVGRLVGALQGANLSLLDLSNVVARSPQQIAPASAEALEAALFSASGLAVARIAESGAAGLLRLVAGARAPGSAPRSSRVCWKASVRWRPPPAPLRWRPS